MSDQLAKYELHICNDIIFIYKFIVKMPTYPSSDWHPNDGVKIVSKNIKQ